MALSDGRPRVIISNMLDAPRQDWRAYEERTRAGNVAWLRALTAQDRFALYCDLFDLIHQSRDPRVDLDRLEQRRWQQKLAARQRVVEAYRRLDEWRERTAQRDAE
jgi:hypothetical protein